MAEQCSKCKTSIRGETGIRCAGVCNKVYHGANKCSGIDQYSLKILEQNNFIRFMCDDCLQYIQNVDMVVRDIQETVQKNKQKLVEYKHEFGSALKENENELKELLKAIEIRYDERMKKIDIVQKSCEKSVEEVKKLYGYIEQFESNNKKMCKSIEDNNMSMCNEIKKVVKQTSEKQTKLSYAETVKSKSVVPDLKKQIPLIVKPKEKQDVDKTKEELNKKVDPVNLKITRVENRRNGAVVIQTESEEEREKVRKAIQSKLDGGYEIKVPSPIDLKIKITDMSFNYEDNEIIEKLIKQNPMITNSEIKIVGKYETKRNNRIIYNVKLIVDNETYTKLMAARKVNIGWERCRVFDGTEVLQCLKCRGYNHLAKDCKNDVTCLKCHGNHKAKDCNKEQIGKCINCIRMNMKLNMELDENHHTNDKKCQVFLNKLNMKKKRVGLAM